MKTILSLALLCLTLNAHGATYLLLSQTNAFKQGITNQAQANADLRAANWQASGTNTTTSGIATAYGFSTSGGVFAGNGAGLTNLSAAAFNTNTLQLALGSLGPVTPVSYTVATLPGGQSPGAYAYCTDTLSPFTATGGPVYYESGAWRLMASKVVPSDTLRGYMENCAAAGWIGLTLWDNAIMVSDATLSGGNGARTFGNTASGTSGGSEAAGVEAGRIRDYLSVASNAAGYGSSGNLIYTPGSGSDVAAVSISANLGINGASDGTDTFCAMFGLYGNVGTNLPTAGVFVLYDRYKLLYTGSETNNWIFTTCTNGVYTFVDSGVAATTLTATIPDRFSMLFTASAVYCYTNGIIAATNSVNLPNISGLYAGAKLYRSQGTNLRYIRYFYPYLHIRRTSAITGL